MASAAAGFYGKLPGRGDFITRNLPRTFTDPWDEWLRAAMATSRVLLDEGWLETYLGSPLWRFALTDGSCSQGEWAGVMMPSVDRVGRYFPLTIAAPIDQGVNPVSVAAGRAEWFERAETLALTALDQDEDFDLEEFCTNVAGLGSPEYEQIRACPPLAGSAGAVAWHLPLQSLETLESALWRILEQRLRVDMDCFSLWWTAGSERVAPALLGAKGLPTAEGYTDMLDGGWQHHAWSHWQFCATNAQDAAAEETSS